jgi:hypothetical protein
MRPRSPSSVLSGKTARSLLIPGLLLLLLPLGACEKKIIVSLSVNFDEVEEAADPTFNYDDYFNREAGDMDLPPDEEEGKKGDGEEEKADASSSKAVDGGKEKKKSKDKVRRLKAGSSITYSWRIEVPRPNRDSVTVICGLPTAGLMQPVRPGQEPTPCSVTMDYGPYRENCTFTIPRKCDDGLLPVQVQAWRSDRPEPILDETHSYRIMRDSMILGAPRLARDPEDPSEPPWAYFQTYQHRMDWSFEDEIEELGWLIEDDAKGIDLFHPCPVAEPPPERELQVGEELPPKRRLNCWLGEAGITIPFVKETAPVAAVEDETDKLPTNTPVKNKGKKGKKGKPKKAKKGEEPPPPPPPPPGITCEVEDDGYGEEAPDSLVDELNSDDVRMMRLKFEFDEDRYRQFFETSYAHRKAGACRYMELFGGLRDAPMPRNLGEFSRMTFLVRSTAKHPVRFGVNLSFQVVNYKMIKPKKKGKKKKKGKGFCKRTAPGRDSRMVILQAGAGWKRFEVDLRRDFMLTEEDLERVGSIQFEILSIIDLGDLYDAVENPPKGELHLAELGFIMLSNKVLPKYRAIRDKRIYDERKYLEELGCKVDEEGMPIGGPRKGGGKKKKGGGGGAPAGPTVL